MDDTRQSFHHVRLVREYTRERWAQRGDKRTKIKEKMVECLCTICKATMNITASRWGVNPPERCGRCSTKKKKAEGEHGFMHRQNWQVKNES